MAGTKEGGKKAVETNKRKHGENFFAEIGAAGGAKGKTGGFWYKKYVLGDVEAVKAAGRKGGYLGKRTYEKAN